MRSRKLWDLEDDINSILMGIIDVVRKQIVLLETY